jgi:hypothetical protein
MLKYMYILLQTKFVAPCPQRPSCCFLTKFDDENNRQTLSLTVALMRAGSSSSSSSCYPLSHSINAII